MAFYDLLVAELRDDSLARGYAGMSDQQAADSLNTANRTAVRMRFASFRTLAAVLDPTEYATAKAVLAAAANGNPLVTDMVKMLELPGSEDGSGGGLDFGSAGVRGFLDYLVAGNMLSAAIVAKMKSVAEHAISRAEELGVAPLRASHINSARQLF